ncbi:MAG: serine/threonine-protein kinase [Euryarchaeota archaeon]|nr:serine/threonine-protein kinase [Euryarchaeota archaeon]
MEDSTIHGKSGKTPYGNYLTFPEFKKEYLSPIFPKKILGKGAFGCVYEATNTTRQKFAIKVVKNYTPESLEEVRIGSHVGSSPYTCGIIAYSVWYGTLYIVMDLIDGDNLYDVLQNNKGYFWENPLELMKIILMILKAVQFLHSKGVVHRDIKLENIVAKYEENGELCGCVVVDLGLANEASKMKHKVVGTPDYLAPECLERNYAKFSFGLDTWAIGVLLHELLFEKTLVPEYDGTPADLFDKIREVIGKPIEPPRSIDDADPKIQFIWTVILACLVNDPERRSSLANLICEVERYLCSIQCDVEAALEVDEVPAFKYDIIISN